MQDHHVFDAVTMENGVAVTGTNTYLSAVLNMLDLTLLCLAFIWTGTPTGTFTVLGSNDQTNWFAISPSTQTPFPKQPTGSGDSTSLTLPYFGFKYAQVQYVNASGSGTITVVATGKA